MERLGHGKTWMSFFFVCHTYDVTISLVVWPWSAYQTIERKKIVIFFIHQRNLRSIVPNLREAFITQPIYEQAPHEEVEEHTSMKS